MMRRAVFSGELMLQEEHCWTLFEKFQLKPPLPRPPTDSQRKGLEKRFQIQKYISKPDRKKLAERLGLKDSQVSEQQRLT